MKAELHEVECKLAVLGDDAEIARERDAETGADCGPIDRGDGRHLEIENRQVARVELEHERA